MTYDIRQAYDVAGERFYSTLQSNLTAREVITLWPTVSLVGAINDAGMCAVPHDPVLEYYNEPSTLEPKTIGDDSWGGNDDDKY